MSFAAHPPSSPSRSKLSSALQSVSLNSPTAKSLRDVVHKSSKKAASTGGIGHSVPSIGSTSSNTLAAGSSVGATRRRNASPVKLFSIRDRIPSTYEDLTGPIPFVESRSTSNSTRSSPVKRQSGSSSTNGGLNAAGGGLGRMDVVGNDFDAKDPRSDSTRRSPGKKGKHYDRYIPSRSTSSTGQDHTGPISESGDLTHTSDLSVSLGIDHNKRILSFHAEPPAAKSETSSLLASYSRLPNRGASGSTAVAAASRRRIATAPERVLDAPGLVDDYYLNLLDWSCTNLVAIGLGESVYVWNAETGDVNLLCSVGGETAAGGVEGDEYVCSLKWAEDGSYLAVGLSSGPIQVYDIGSGGLVRTMSGHLSRVPSLSWSGAILSSGCRTGDIWNSDVRVGQHRVAEMKGHRGEVCGLEWRPEMAGGLSGGGQGLLASGGNDNVVNVWDGRNTSTAKMSKTNHTAAVKALAWCPWTPHLLASGGGSSDRTIHFWNTTTSSRLNSLVTPSQVTSLVFNPHSREILSSHGIPDHQLSIWAYPSLEKVCDIPQAHETRILHSCLSPDGTVVATASSDENLKFWRVFDGPKKTAKGKNGMGSSGGTKEVEEGDGIQKKGRTGISVR